MSVLSGSDHENIVADLPPLSTQRGPSTLVYNTAIQNQPNTTGGIRETSNLVELRFVSGKGGQWGQTERQQGSPWLLSRSLHWASGLCMGRGWWTWWCRKFLNDCRSNTASLWEEESIKGNGWRSKYLNTVCVANKNLHDHVLVIWVEKMVPPPNMLT